MAALRIGYVGIGLMGLPMVERLRGLGYPVRAYDIVAARMEAAGLAGAVPATSPADAAQGVDVVLLNLPTTDAVEAAVFGADGVAAALHAPQVLVDFSTVEVGRGRGFASRLRETAGCGWIDAPVSGGPPASAGGTLTVMAGARRTTSRACGRSWATSRPVSPTWGPMAAASPPR